MTTAATYSRFRASNWSAMITTACTADAPWCAPAVVANSLKMNDLSSQFEGEGIPSRVASILLAGGGKRQALQLEECCDDIRWIDRSPKRNDGSAGLRVASV
jgi:hypothetical protein